VCEEVTDILVRQDRTAAAGLPVLAIRQVGASLSTGWFWLVAQTSPEPAYAAQVLVYRYPLPYTAGGTLDF
jgi:hypothetical protein